MKKRMKTHHHPMNGWKVHDATWFGTSALMVCEAETTVVQHLKAAKFPAECEPIRKESRIMKFLRNM